jgi:predicted secreted protein
MSDIVEVCGHENGKQIDLHRQQILRVTLSEVRTAGFRWILRPLTLQALSLVTEELSPPSTGPGGAATHHWDFRADKPGTMEITLDYRRPWEHAAPDATARSFTVSVRVV